MAAFAAIFPLAALLLTLSTLALASPVPSNATLLRECQTGCGGWVSSARLVGDGNPHQNYLHKQLSQTLTCDQENSCSVGQEQSISYSIGWMANTAGPFWLSGGFAVTETWETGNAYDCDGRPGDTICIWQSIAHTAYTVQDFSVNPTCGGSEDSGDPYTEWSPNENNAGGGFYCVVGTCQDQGDQDWDVTGRAGGP